MFARFVLVSGSILMLIPVWSQKQANVWYFGHYAGLDFNHPTPQPLLDGQTYTPLPNLWNEGTGVMCDSSGALLFYCNGAKIWNRDQEIMLNGDSLLGHPSSTQASLILARPGSDRFFYVFTTAALEGGFENGLRYNLVDACLDSSLGGVVPSSKNVPMLANTCEKLAAIRHVNGTDYWVVTHLYQTNTFVAFLLTSQGITSSVESMVGPEDVLGWGGQMAFSPDGLRLAYAYPSTWGSLSLYDFDRATGMITNPKVHANAIDDQAYGVAFSSNSSLLYVTSNNAGKIFQYDLTAGDWNNVINTRTVLAAENPSRWFSLALGPDDKVYVANNDRHFLGRIELPNVVGAGCQYVDEAVSLGSGTSSFGLPNIVTSYDYSNRNVLCGTADAVLDRQQLGFSIFPNPTTGKVMVRTNMPMVNCSLELFDMMGHSVVMLALPNPSYASADLSFLPPGVYMYDLRSSMYRFRGTLILVQP